MPPVYKSVMATEIYDGSVALDLRSMGINLIYLPNFLGAQFASTIFERVVSDPSCLSQHSYIGNFNRIITPKRLTYAYIKDQGPCINPRQYRFKGKNLHRRPDGPFTSIFHQLVARLPHGFKVAPDTSIVNGYRYNGTDYIACHTDDEKFLMSDNTSWWSDSTIATITLLRDQGIPMTYYAGDPTSGMGIGIRAQHGSIILQGSVLHEVRPVPLVCRREWSVASVASVLHLESFKIGATILIQLRVSNLTALKIWGPVITFIIAIATVSLPCRYLEKPTPLKPL